ncbi:MAG: transglutaminase-like domain-containing protein [Candidatus Thermoplasmatota archaeon]|nr:transglutaminase-like domain-containing protein [Candidatus Thermoplasmatota archaeon]
MRLATILIALVMISGCISWPFGETYRTGFKEGDLTVLGNYDYYSPLVDKPEAKLSMQPGYKYNISWEVSRVYVNYGGVAKIVMENTGVNDLFIYNYRVNIGNSEWKWMEEEKGIIIKKDEKKKAYMAFGAPSAPGNYDYRLSCSFMVNNLAGNLPSPKNRWYDNGTAYFSKNDINVMSYNISSVYTSSKNYYYYFDKINDMVTFDLTIYAKAQEIILPFSGNYRNYNIFQVCSIYDYILENLKYTNDKEGKDVWSDPVTTLKRRGGDCEDYAMLFSAFVSSIGGTARIYMTDNHAFATVYIGNSTRANEVLDDINDYYGTDLFFAVLEDKFGYWLVADPLGSFYLGGLPVGGDVVGPCNDKRLYNWDFTQTGHVNIIDIMRE